MDKVNTCVGVSFYKKETPTQLFFVNIAIFLRTSFFYRTSPVAAPE